jgi:hypothetical protein
MIVLYNIYKNASATVDGFVQFLSARPGSATTRESELERQLFYFERSVRFLYSIKA